jgi:predicted DsbA family dithiol-disulfide isomerase
VTYGRRTEAIGVDAEQVARALESDAHAQRVRADFMGGVRSGVNGTPTLGADAR